MTILVFPPSFSTPFPEPTVTVAKSTPVNLKGVWSLIPGAAFFRQESATRRDLGVLAASLHKKANGSLRVLDALCGCGIWSQQYLKKAEADFVVSKYGNKIYGSTIIENLKRVLGNEEKRWVVTHITPLFPYYAYHGPVFRVLLRLNRGKVHDSRHYGFIGYCHQCGIFLG